MIDRKPNERRMLLAHYLGPQRRRVVILAVVLLSSIGLQLLNPQILRYFIDAASAGATQERLMAAAAFFVIAAFCQQVLAVGATYVSEQVGWTATNTLRADLLLHCLRLDQRFHTAHTPGELIERIDGDTTALAKFFSQFVIQVLGNLLLLLGVLVVLWVIDWRIGLTNTLLAALVLFALTKIQAYVTPQWEHARQASAELFGFLEERLASTEDIRASGAQAYTMHRLYERMRAHMRAERSARLRARLSWTSLDLFRALATGTMYAGGAFLFTNGALTIGTLYVIFFYTSLLFFPLQLITEQAADFQKASAGSARILDLLAERSTLAADAAMSLGHGALPVTFDHVTFGYHGDTPVLKDVSLALAPGNVLGVLGRTGSGKTTLMRLLFRLYDPQAGSICLGDVDIRQASLSELRRRVGVVTQDVQLFRASVRDNLRLFDEHIGDAQLMAAIETLGLGPWLHALPHGLDTVLAANNGGLSAGEAQLLAFTRILLRDPGVVVLDEASSRLDPATEQLIERAIGKLLRNRTAIIIAHRLHTVQRADEILILEDGTVREHGARDDLARDPHSRFHALLQGGLEGVLQ